MLDAIYVLMTIGFFVLCAVFGRALSRIGSDDHGARDQGAGDQDRAAPR